MLWAPGTARPSVPMNGPLGKLGAAREQVFSRMRCPSSVQGSEGPAMSLASKKSGQSAVVTGAGSGLGRDIALALAARGYIVFGTAFAAVEVQDLEQASGGRVRLTVCDITKEQAVRAWAVSVSDALGATGLDLLVNNAGILTPGPLEILPLDAVRHEFEVNVFGALS